MDFFANPKDHAHPKARNLMIEDFFWSPIDEAGPFGSDSGSDAAEGYNQWRKEQNSKSAIIYLRDLLLSWGFPLFDWNELNPDKIQDYIQIRASTDNISQQIEHLKEALSNSPGLAPDDFSDQSFQELIQRSAEGMGGIYLLQIDNAIIGTGFAQFVMEGRIEDDLQYLTSTALTRQLLPILIDRYDEDYKKVRKSMLTKMMDVIERANL